MGNRHLAKLREQKVLYKALINTPNTVDLLVLGHPKMATTYDDGEGKEVTAAHRAAVGVLWDYMALKHPLEKVDAIFVMGSYDIRSAEQGAKLFLEGWAPLLIFSGGLGNFTLGHFTEPEAQRFAKRAIEMGVPEDSILIEDKSTNSGENIKFTRDLLDAHGIAQPETIIIVQKPTMMRRSFATIEKQWPEVRGVCQAMELTFEDIPHGHMTPSKVVSEMVGDMQRILLYPELGFQSKQEVPESVMSAYKELVAAGYDSHMIKN